MALPALRSNCLAIHFPAQHVGDKLRQVPRDITLGQLPRSPLRLDKVGDLSWKRDREPANGRRRIALLFTRHSRDFGAPILDASHLSIVISYYDLIMPSRSVPVTKRETDRHLIAAYDHLLAAAPRVDGARHTKLLAAIGAIRSVRRDLKSERGQTRAKKP